MQHNKIFLSFKLTALVMSLLFGGSAMAGGADSGYGKITNLHFSPRTENGQVRISFSNSIKNPENCEKTEFYMYEFDDSPASSRFYSTILAAYMAGKTVKFWIYGCTKEKHWGATRPMLYDIYVQP